MNVLTVFKKYYTVKISAKDWLESFEQLGKEEQFCALYWLIYSKEHKEFSFDGFVFQNNANCWQFLLALITRNILFVFELFQKIPTEIYFQNENETFKYVTQLFKIISENILLNLLNDFLLQFSLEKREILKCFYYAFSDVPYPFQFVNTPHCKLFLFFQLVVKKNNVPIKEIALLTRKLWTMKMINENDLEFFQPYFSENIIIWGPPLLSYNLHTDLANKIIFSQISPIFFQKIRYKISLRPYYSLWEFYAVSQFVKKEDLLYLLKRLPKGSPMYYPVIRPVLKKILDKKWSQLQEEIVESGMYLESRKDLLDFLNLNHMSEIAKMLRGIYNDD